MYSERESNPHDHCWSQDFKSGVSTCFTIRAFIKRGDELLFFAHLLMLWPSTLIMGFWYLVPIYCPLLAGGRFSCYDPAIALYGRQDSNLRPLAPKASTLTGLCYFRKLGTSLYHYRPVPGNESGLVVHSAK